MRLRPRTGGTGRSRAGWIGRALLAAAMAVTTPSVGATHPTGSTPDGGAKLRALHPLVPRLLEEGQALSPTLATLVRDLAGNDGVIVYVDVDQTGRSGPSGTLRFMAAGDAHRFFRVQLEAGSTAWPTDLRKLIVVLAHELWHVHEAAAAGVASAKEFEQLFQSIGTRVRGRTFETAAAQAISEAVRLEVYGVTPGAVAGTRARLPASEPR